MRAAVVEAFGPPEAVTIKDVPAPEPGPGEVLIRTSVAGVNFADAGMARGTNRRAEPPFVPGVEGAGTVTALGEGVTEIAAGVRGVYWNAKPSAFAEYVAVPAWRVVPIPDDIPDEVAVAFMVQGATAHYLAIDTATLQPGQTALVYSAAGGVGSLLTQIAVLRGARVIGTVGRPEKVQLARELGAEVIIDRSREDILAVVLAATGDAGCEAVFDAVGAATIDQSLRATKAGGVCVLYGAASGAPASIDDALTARVTFRRTGLADHLKDAAEFRRRMGDLFAWHRDGKVVPRFGGEWPLERTGEALARIASGETTGKLLIRA